MKINVNKTCTTIINYGSIRSQYQNYSLLSKYYLELKRVRLQEGKGLKWLLAPAISPNVTLLLIWRHMLSHLLCKGGWALCCWEAEGRWDGAVWAIQGMLCDLHDLACL